MHRFALALLPLALLGCDPGCEAAEALEPDSASGTIGDIDWEAGGATWLAEATGVNVSTSPGTDGWRVTFVAQTSDAGKEVSAKVRRGGLPVDVVLLTGVEGGWATINNGNEDTFSTTDEDATGGTLRISRKAGKQLYGCGTFTASDGRDEITATVSFRALEPSL